MSAPVSLADRMKRYEHTFRTSLPPRSYVLLRVDGVAFHTYTRGLQRPFDDAFAADMDAAAVALCQRVEGARLAFVQSDEISVLTTDLDHLRSQHWMGGVTAKVVSLSASQATATFNQRRSDGGAGGSLALFDSRVWAMTDPAEVLNYFLWRQRDAVKNSISMAASTYFDHTTLQGLNSDQRQDLLWSREGVNWNDYPDGFKRGRVVLRREQAEDVTYTDRRTQTTEVASRVSKRWTVEAAPRFNHEPTGLLRGLIPTLGWPTPSASLGQDSQDSQGDRETAVSADA